MRALIVLMLVGFCFGAAAPGALAQDDGDDAPAPIELTAGDEQARVHFNNGRASYDRGNYTEAAEEFEAGYAYAPLSAFLFNLYLTYERLGDFRTAATHLERYLRIEPDIDGHAMLSERLERLRERAAGQEAEDARVAESEAAAAAAAARAEEATAAAARAEEQARRAEARRVEAQGPDLFVPAMISYGIGAAGIASFAIFGALASSENASLESSCGTAYADAGTCEEGAADGLRAYSLAADISLGVGIAGVIAGTVLILLHDPDSDGDEVAIAPIIGPDVAGISAAGVF